MKNRDGFTEELDSIPPLGGSQPPVTPAPEDLTPFPGLFCHPHLCEHTCTQTYTHIYIQTVKQIFKGERLGVVFREKRRPDLTVDLLSVLPTHLGSVLEICRPSWDRLRLSIATASMTLHKPPDLLGSSLLIWK